MEIRRYVSSDCAILLKLFYQTVHTVNAKDYTKEQLDAWATGDEDLKAWDKSFKESLTLVAVEGEKIAGFGNIRADGYLDKLYVSADAQRRGAGTALCDALESAATEKIFTHASVTARGFFLARGYVQIKEQTVERRGVKLLNYVMEKQK